MMVQLLFWLAVLPGVFLIVKIYKKDKIEKEPVGLILLLLLLGGLSTVPVAYIEMGMESLLTSLINSDSLIYLVVENIIGIALIEELGKFIVTDLLTWRNKAFNYQFDGVVYAVCASMGFAIVENIGYVFSYGFSTGIVRMLTAIPAHCIFGIFMGHYYGLAKEASLNQSMAEYSSNRAKCIIVPVLLHGIYDLTASFGGWIGLVIFFVFVLILDIVAIVKINKYSREDVPLGMSYYKNMDN